MESLYLLIPIVLITVVIAVAVLLWAIKSGQYDDLDKESRRILLDDDILENDAESSDNVRRHNGEKQKANEAGKVNEK